MLYVHRSARSDLLAEALGEVLREPLASPLAREVISVPTRGVERWLSQKLARYLGTGAAPGATDGICANVDWPFPGVLVSTATAAALGTPSGGPGGGDGPWAPDAAVWPLVELIDEHVDDPRLAPLAAHLRASSPSGDGRVPRRFATARHIADLFDRYAVHRPEMVLAWAASAGDGAAGDGGGCGPARRGEDVAWQSQLWRWLRERIGTPSPAERAQAALARVEQSPELLDLPERISCFGLTRFPASHLQVLRAIAARRDVHLFLLHPSPALWEKVAATCPAPAAPLARAEDPTAELAANRLLRSWGRDSREMQLVLAAQGTGGGEVRPVPERAGPPSLLARLQADVRSDREPPGPARPGGTDARPVLAPDDDSLRLPASPGRARQVEVAHEAVLHLLRADPTLEPRDVVIMCPDIEEFAPLVTAVFGAAALDGGPELRARLADRSVRQTNPLLAVAAHLLELAASRATASQVLDFASRGPVSRRFGYDEDELSQAARWLEGTGVRWGVDAAYRAPWKLDNFAGATWRAGLDRLLLGVAMADDGHLVGGRLPFGDLSSSETDLAGRLVEMLDRLSAALVALSGPMPVGQWAAELSRGLSVLACSGPGEEWQDEQLRRTLQEVVADAGGSPAPVDLAEVRALLADRLRGRPTSANFRTGDLTICTLVPMRSVPHRVVCLLGLDDGTFPRPSEQDGDDLLLAEPVVGDRDVPGEDRQLLLDALLAATDHLVVTYEGHDQHLNQRRPPCVPVAELLDAVDRTVRLGTGDQPARSAVVVEHPLQAFDPRNFSPGGVVGSGAWRFDQVQLRGAAALKGRRRARALFLSGRLPPLGEATVNLSSLVRFLEHPVRAFLRARLGYYAGDLPEPLSDSIPLELGPLDRWALGDRLLAQTVAGVPLAAAVAAERGRGLLPPAVLADDALDEVTGVVGALTDQLRLLPGAQVPAGPVGVNLTLPDGRALVGTVPGVHEGAIVRCVYSKLAPKHRLRAWAQFVALSAAQAQPAPSAVTIGQSEGSKPDRPRLAIASLAPLVGTGDDRRAQALGLLQDVVDLYDRGMREPLPLYCATSAAWARARLAGESPDERAGAKWSSNWDDVQGESAEPEHQLVLGQGVGFDGLREEPPRDDEAGDGWETAEKSRLGRLALRLWAPLLHHEETREL